MQQLTELLAVLAWPIVVVIGLVMFRRPLGDLLSRDDVSVTGPAGIAISARRAASALVEASAVKGGAVSAPQAEDQAREVSAFVRRLRRDPRVLWVDDQPSNNRYERRALESMGMVVDLSTSTDDALRTLRRGGYDVVISDMGRPEDPRAGYLLLRAMRDRGDRTPFVVYSSSDAPGHYDEAISEGAVGSTARPEELIDMVLLAIRDTRPRARRWWTGR